MASLSRALAAWLASLLAAGAAAAVSLDEDRLRAAFVLRIAQYTQWPQASGALSLCTAGLSSGEAEMQALAQRQAGEAAVRVRAVESPREAAGLCQLLVLGHGDAATLRRWVQGLGDAPVLVLGTSPEAMRAGVAVALITEPQGMAFSVNPGEAKRRGLTLAAPVLKLAREVR